MPESDDNSDNVEFADDLKSVERSVAVRQRRKLKGRAEKRHGVWFGLGMMGLIGWTIAVPALIGVAVGLWIDTSWPSRVSWTVMLLVLGVAIGCLNAWNWVKKEGLHRHNPADAESDVDEKESSYPSQD